MFKQIITGITFILLTIYFNQLYAQQKYEKESRLKEKDVPSKALDFIDSLEVKGRVRWYLEEGFDRTSIEAKLKFNNQKCSIEFDSIGNLEDIEIPIEWNYLQKSLKDSILVSLGEDCKKFKIQKNQIQYSGDRSTLLSKMKTRKSGDNYIVRYELVVKCSNTKNIALFEYLFNDTGRKLAFYQIVFKNSSNLEY